MHEVIIDTKDVCVVRTRHPIEGTSWDIFWFAHGVKCARFSTCSPIVASILSRGLVEIIE